jgi:magnesium transporter
MRAPWCAQREIGMQGSFENEDRQLSAQWIRGEPGEIASANRELLDRIEDLTRNNDEGGGLAIVSPWEPADVGDLMIYLPIKFARRLYDWLPTELASEVLAEVSPDLRSNLVEHADIERIAEITEGLHEDDAVELLDDLPAPVVEQLLQRLSDGEDLRERLEFEEDTAGEAMTSKFVAVLDGWNVRTATRAVRKMAAEIETFYEVYVVNEARQLVGRLQLRDLLLNKKKTKIRDIMREVSVFVYPDADQEDVLELARMYDVQTIPVVDEELHVIGRITVEELQEIVRDEAEEDIMLMSGLAPDALPDDSVGRIIRGRLPWLAGGLVGAALAGAVVGSFEEQLKQAAILASFIPVVMAMAGNAGIQASTVTVQGLAAGNLWIGDLGGRVVKELMGSLINGALIAVALGLIVVGVSQFMHFEEPVRLATAAGLSVLLVTMIAATIGSTIPLVLNHFDIDPAVATGVFITTANDILGVLVYFTVASTIYLTAIS